MRPFQVAMDDFARRLFDMATTPEAVALQRVLAAEALSQSELVDAFLGMGPHVTRDAIARYLCRKDIREQLVEDLPWAQMPVYLTNCVLGDQTTRVLGRPHELSSEGRYEALAHRMKLFYRSVLS